MRTFTETEIETAVALYKEYVLEPEKIEAYKKTLANMPPEISGGATPYEFGRTKLAIVFAEKFGIEFEEAQELVQTVRKRWGEAYYG